jgi:hypothetical protein
MALRCEREWRVLYTTQRNMLALCIVFVIVVVSCLQTKVIVKLFQQHKELSIQDITAYTYIRTDDVISTLQTLNFIRYHEGQQYERQAVSPPPPFPSAFHFQRGWHYMRECIYAWMILASQRAARLDLSMTRV